MNSGAGGGGGMGRQVVTLCVFQGGIVGGEERR